MHFAGEKSTKIKGERDERRTEDLQKTQTSCKPRRVGESVKIKKLKDSYNCLNCQRTFKNKTSFTMHLRFKCSHKDSLNFSSAQRYEWARCGRSYKYKKSLPLHMRFECRRKDCISSVRVPNSDTINVAELTKNFECIRCVHMFYCKKTLAFHMQVMRDLSQTAIIKTPTSTSRNNVFEEVNKRC